MGRRPFGNPIPQWEALWLTDSRRVGSLSEVSAQRAAATAAGPDQETPGCSMNDAILREISDFCRETGLAESTFGRRAVNDGKLAARLRNGGRITTDTLDRIRAFMAENRGPDASLREPVIGWNGGSRIGGPAIGGPAVSGSMPAMPTPAPRAD